MVRGILTGRALQRRARPGPDVVATETDGPSTPTDERVNLPLEQRQVRRTVMPSGTVVLTYMDDPMGTSPGAPHGSADDDDDGWEPPIPGPRGSAKESPGAQSRKLDSKRGLR